MNIQKKLNSETLKDKTQLEKTLLSILGDSYYNRVKEELYSSINVLNALYPSNQNGVSKILNMILSHNTGPSNIKQIIQNAISVEHQFIKNRNVILSSMLIRIETEVTKCTNLYGISNIHGAVVSGSWATQKSTSLSDFDILLSHGLPADDRKLINEVQEQFYTSLIKGSSTVHLPEIDLNMMEIPFTTQGNVYSDAKQTVNLIDNKYIVVTPIAEVFEYLNGILSNIKL